MDDRILDSDHLFDAYGASVGETCYAHIEGECMCNDHCHDGDTIVPLSKNHCKDCHEAWLLDREGYFKD